MGRPAEATAAVRRQSSTGWVLRALLALIGSVNVTASTRAGAQEPPAFYFNDVTTASGIEFTHVTGASGRKYMIETMGSGAVFFDYDGDADPDLYLVNGGALPGFESENPVTGALYRNDGRGHFTDVTARSGLDFVSYGMGAVAGDYDNDGDADLYITELGPNRLFRNQGDGSFTEVTESSGVVNGLWSASASFSDLDGDGNLDLYVTNYLRIDLDHHPDCSQRRDGRVVLFYCLPDAFPGVPDALYHNRGDTTFEDVSKRAGVDRSEGKGLGVVAFDYDGDGLPDLYVANDTVPNFLFHNDGELRFSEVGLETGVAYDGDGRAQAGMGVDVGDYDRDGDLDLWVTNFQGESNTLYRNDDHVFFSDVSLLAGLGRPSLRSLGFGTGFVDLDNDGLLDLVVANGHVLDNTAMLTEGSSYPQRNQLFKNRGGGQFEELSHAGPGFERVNVSRGLAVADLDNDGDLDLLFTNSGGRIDLLQNETRSGNSLRLQLIGRRANRDGVGARVIVDLGDETYFASELLAGSSYLSQNEGIVHVGLGERREVRSVIIQWPGTGEEIIGPLESGQLVVVVEGVGVVAAFPFDGHRH